MKRSIAYLINNDVFRTALAAQSLLIYIFPNLADRPIQSTIRNVRVLSYVFMTPPEYIYIYFFVSYYAQTVIGEASSQNLQFYFISALKLPRSIFLGPLYHSLKLTITCTYNYLQAQGNN